MKTVDCACVIHGDYYSWTYVDRLYNMLQANCSHEIRLHVFTETARSVPPHMVKHDLTEWPYISGPKRSWWYKMQLFDCLQFSGQLLYLDLDTVIVNNIDWIWKLDPDRFYAIHDFKRLWRPSWTGINSSLMLWDTVRWHWIWEKFCNDGFASVSKSFRGDQDFIGNMLYGDPEFSYFSHNCAKSWRWQVDRGGINFTTRRSLQQSTVIAPDTSFLIFHGQPKPHEVDDTVVKQLWR